MMAVPAWVPFDETLVKKLSFAVVGYIWYWASGEFGKVAVFSHVLRLFELVTMRPIPSDPTKYDGPHLHLPTFLVFGLSGPPGT